MIKPKPVAGQVDTGIRIKRKASLASRGRDRAWSVVLPMLIVLVAAAIMSDAPRRNETIRIEWFVSGGLGLALILVFKWKRKLDWLSVPVVYGIVFWLFHFGLVFPAAIAPDILELYPTWARDRLFDPANQLAVLLSLLFLCGFLLGFSVLNPKDKPESASNNTTSASRLVKAGWAVIIVGLVLWTTAIERFGFDIFFGSYFEFFRVHNHFSNPVLVVAFGLMLQAAGGRSLRSILMTAAVFYLPILLPPLAAGARTAPLFSALVLAVVLTKRGLRLPRSGVWLAAIIALMVTASLREIRTAGLVAVLEGRERANIESPLSGMTELGGSLLPVSATIDYVRWNGYFYGETYAYPVWRQIERFTSSNRGTVETDARFIAERINSLYGSIGYSTVAEAYVNGGAIAVLLFSVLLGMCLFVLDRRANTPYGLAILAAVLLPMMVNIRNSFIYVPGWIFMAMIPIVVARYLPERGTFVKRKRGHLAIGGRTAMSRTRVLKEP